jgi:hypothetical protein
MEKLIIHQLSDEIKLVEKENENLKYKLNIRL